MLSPDPSLTKPPTLQRVKGMPASSASLVRNRHLASLASGIAAFHRNEETEATVSALLWELSDENAKILTGVERACATAMDAASSDVLCATSSLAGSPKVVPPAQALSNVWMSRADTSVHWVLTRLRRLEALVQSSDAHLSFVEQEIPAAAAAFRKELEALSSIGLSATITSACLDGYLDRHRGVLDRIASLRDVLERNGCLFDRYCAGIGEGLDSFDLMALGGLNTTPLGIPVDAVLNALVQHVGASVLRYTSDRDAVIKDMLAELVDVGDAAYRSRLEARASDALASGVADIVSRVAGKLFTGNVVLGVKTADRKQDCDGGSGNAPFTVVLKAPTIEEAAQVARELLAQTAAEINRLVSSVIDAADPVDVSAIEALGSFIVHSGPGCRIRVSAWLVVEVDGDDEAQAETQLHSPCASLAVGYATTGLPAGLDERIESVVGEAALLKEALLGHLRSTKEELAPHVPTIVSDMQERTWILEAAVDRLRYDCDVAKCLRGDDEASFDDSMLPEKGALDGLLRSLRSKVLKTEQALLDDVQDMQARAMDIHADLGWMKGVQSYSMIDLEVKLGELGVTLDQCVDRAHVGSR